MKRTIALLISLTFALMIQAYTLVIDAGHGGKDAGAVSRNSKEKDINLAVALALGNLVKQNCPDVKVIYTRDKDVFVALDERANIANQAKADLFISIHTNSTAQRVGPTGTEIYTLGMHRAADNLAVAQRENSVITMESNYQQKYEGFDPNSSESYIIFEFIQDHNMEKSVAFARTIQSEFRATAKRPNRGVHQAGFLVLRATSMPSVLVELGYINNSSDETFLTSKKGTETMAQSIFNAFKAYKK